MIVSASNTSLFESDINNLEEIEKEEMQEKRRIEEMQMQIKMKKLEIEQFMLSKEKKERVPLVQNIFTQHLLINNNLTDFKF
jgi:hypothetical protein